MASVLERPATVAKDTGTFAGGSIETTAKEWVGRDRVNIYLDQRPIALARIQKLAALQQCIDHDVKVLISVRSVLDQMSRLDSCLIKDVVAERHTGTLRVLVENVIQELFTLDELCYSEPHIAMTQNVKPGTISDIHARLVELDQDQEALSLKRLTKNQVAIERGKVQERFERLVADLKKETGYLHQQVKKICDESADKAKKQITVLADVIEELLPPDHMPRQRVEANEPTAAQFPPAAKWMESANVEAITGDISLEGRERRERTDG